LVGQVRLVAGSRRGGRWAAIAYTLIESAKKCGANAWEYMRDLLENFQSARPSEFHKWLPDQWLKAKLAAGNPEAAAQNGAAPNAPR